MRGRCVVEGDVVERWMLNVDSLLRLISGVHKDTTSSISYTCLCCNNRVFSRKYLYSLIYRALKYMHMMKQSTEEPSLTLFHFIFMFDTKFVRVSLFHAEVVVVEMSFNDDGFVERTEDTGKE